MPPHARSRRLTGRPDKSSAAPTLLGSGTPPYPLPGETLFTFGGSPLPDPATPPPERGIVIAHRLGDSTRLTLVTPESGQLAVGAAPVTYSDALRLLGAAASAATAWPVLAVTPVPAAKLSLSALGRGRLERVMGQTHGELSGYPSFAGFAIHHVWSYRDLLEGASAASDSSGAGQPARSEQEQDQGVQNPQAD